MPAAWPASTFTNLIFYWTSGDDANISEAEEVTATVTSTAPPAKETPTVAEFMSAAVPWPGSPSDPGHVGLWFSMPNQSFDPTKKVDNNNKKQFISGWPFYDVDQFVQRAGWITNIATDKFKDVWFCTSLQRVTGKTKHGKPKAQKGQSTVVSQKAIWIDIDVKANDQKHYATHDEAWQAFVGMRKSLGLPPPSAVVNTGGGLHIYWISDKPLLPHEWAPYANGLKALLLANDFKFDPTCTADSARILRVPGTFNYKYDPPRPVELLPVPLRLYDFAELDFLKQHAGQAPAQGAQAHQLYAEGANIASLNAGPASLFKITGEPGLEAGIDKFGDNLLDPLPIFKQCGFYREALLNGGKNNDQPQWNLAVLGTTFMRDGTSRSSCWAHPAARPTSVGARTAATFLRIPLSGFRIWDPSTRLSASCSIRPKPPYAGFAGQTGSSRGHPPSTSCSPAI